jgi:hypothetical protein
LAVTGEREGRLASRATTRRTPRSHPVTSETSHVQYAQPLIPCALIEDMLVEGDGVSLARVCVVIVVPENLTKRKISELCVVAVHIPLNAIAGVTAIVVVNVDDQASLTEQITVNSDQFRCDDVWRHEPWLNNEERTSPVDMAIMNREVTVKIDPAQTALGHLSVFIVQDQLMHRH